MGLGSTKPKELKAWKKPKMVFFRPFDFLTPCKIVQLHYKSSSLSSIKMAF